MNNEFQLADCVDCEDKTADELAYEEYLQGRYSYEDYCAVCDIEECEPEPPFVNISDSTWK